MYPCHTLLVLHFRKFDMKAVLGSWVICFTFKSKSKDEIRLDCWAGFPTQTCLEIKRGQLLPSYCHYLLIRRSVPSLRALLCKLNTDSFVCKGSTGVHKQVLLFISLNNTLTVSHAHFCLQIWCERKMYACYSQHHFFENKRYLLCFKRVYQDLKINIMKTCLNHEVNTCHW